MRLARNQQSPDFVRRAALAAGVGLGLTTLFLLYREPSRRPRRPKPDVKPTPPPPQPKGRPLCPYEVPGHAPADLTGVQPGDFVIVTLSNPTGNLRESTWAKVLNVGTHLAVEVVSSQKTGGPAVEAVPESLRTDWHGFTTGQRVFLDPKCVWDVLHTHTEPGTLLCGPKGAAAAGTPMVGHRDLRAGDSVKLVLGAPDGSALETSWVVVQRISPTGSVVTAQVAEPPQHAAAHGFAAGTTLEFARDCIFGIRPV